MRAVSVCFQFPVMLSNNQQSNVTLLILTYRVIVLTNQQNMTFVDSHAKVRLVLIPNMRGHVNEVHFSAPPSHRTDACLALAQVPPGIHPHTRLMLYSSALPAPQLPPHADAAQACNWALPPTSPVSQHTRLACLTPHPS